MVKNKFSRTNNAQPTSLYCPTPLTPFLPHISFMHPIPPLRSHLSLILAHLVIVEYCATQTHTHTQNLINRNQKKVKNKNFFQIVISPRAAGKKTDKRLCCWKHTYTQKTFNE